MTYKGIVVGGSRAGRIVVGVVAEMPIDGEAYCFNEPLGVWSPKGMSETDIVALLLAFYAKNAPYQSMPQTAAA